jgi:replicative DNA helicase
MTTAGSMRLNQSLNDILGLTEHDLGRPQDIQAENYLIGSLLADGDLLDEVIDVVAADDFLRDWNRHAFNAILDCARYDEPISPENVARRVSRKLEETEEDGYQTLVHCGRLRYECYTPSRAAFYAGLVAAESFRRRVIEAWPTIQGLALNYELPVDQVVSRIEATMQEVLCTGREELTSVNVGTSISAFIAEIKRDAAAGGKEPGHPTGIRVLDYNIGGLKRGELIVAAGSTSVGKSAFATRICESFGQRGGRVLYFSLEMSRDALRERLIAAFARIDLTSVSRRKFLPGELDRVIRAEEQLSTWDIEIDEYADASTAYIRSRARRHAMRKPLDLIIVDHIHIMREPGKFDREDLRLGSISSNLHAIAKEQNIPVLALAQLNREPGKRAGNRPMLDDIQGSARIAQDSDVVLILHRPEQANSGKPGYHPPRVEQAEVLVMKNRSGPRGAVIPVAFEGYCVRYDTLTEER